MYVGDLMTLIIVTQYLQSWSRPRSPPRRPYPLGDRSRIQICLFPLFWILAQFFSICPILLWCLLQHIDTATQQVNLKYGIAMAVAKRIPPREPACRNMLTPRCFTWSYCGLHHFWAATLNISQCRDSSYSAAN